MKEIISNKQLRDFGLLIGFGFPILIGWLIPALTGHGFRCGQYSSVCQHLLLGLLHHAYCFIHIKWMGLGNALGWVNSRIILSLVFIIVLLPISFLMRIIGYDPLRTKLKGDKTYRESRKDYQRILLAFFNYEAFIDLVKRHLGFLKGSQEVLVSTSDYYDRSYGSTMKRWHGKLGKVIHSRKLL